MAITVETFQTAIAGEGNEVTDSIRAVSENLMKLYEEDVRGLKYTNAALKEEKTDIVNKWRADQDKFAEEKADYESRLSQAQEQIKKSNPEEAQKYFENQREVLESGYKSQIAERDTKITELTNQIEGFKQREIYTSMQNEFRRAASKANVASDSLDIVENFILGANGCNFTPRDTSEGRVFWSNDNSGDTIDTRLDKFLKTPSGKRFLPFNSTGSGAEGGFGGSSGSGSKTLTLAEFNKLSPAERSAKMKEGYKIS